MLDVEAQKLGFHNVVLFHKDVEDLPDSLGQVDRITCASGLVLLRDIPTTLSKWKSLLALDGLMIVDGPADDALLPGILAADAASEMDLAWPVQHALGNKQNLLP